MNAPDNHVDADTDEILAAALLSHDSHEVINTAANRVTPTCRSPARG